jgi:HEAT repeat protein
VTALTLKMSDFGLRHSLEASTRELLFVPLPSDLRLRARAILDLLTRHSAKGLAALLLLPVTFGLLTPVGAGWLALGLVVVWLALATAVYRAYVRSLRTSLKEGSVDSAVPINLNDVKTVELLVHSLGSADPRQVLHSLELLEANGRANLVPPLLLHHDDEEVRRRTLQILADVGRRDAAPLVERRLGDASADVRAEAVRALTELSAADACDLMLPRLQESDPRVRAAAVTCLFNYGDTATVCAARAALYDMLFDAAPEQRAEAVKAIGAIRGNEFDGRLLQALYDCDARVGREAIGAVRRVVGREGFSPLYTPRLVSLLANRRLKYDAAEALVAFGEEVIPLLVHFMNEPEEAVWVRRALPKTLARIPGPKTMEALLEALHTADDAPLRAQIVEALALRRAEIARCGGVPRIEAAITAEARRCLTRLQRSRRPARQPGVPLRGADRAGRSARARPVVPDDRRADRGAAEDAVRPAGAAPSAARRVGGVPLPTERAA